METEEEFRARLDERGILRDLSIEPRRAQAFTVFAQQKGARIDLGAWQRNAVQFFQTEIGLSVPKRYEAEWPERDAAHFVVLAPGGRAATRLCYGRPRADDDLRAAEDADTKAGLTGLGTLARRCPMVWLVAVESDADRTALLLSAILASVALGPILPPDQAELFGVRTARQRLEDSAGPYR
jgi:hypothetical protein